MTQAKDAIKAGPVYKTLLMVLLVITSVLSGAVLLQDDTVSIDIEGLEDSITNTIKDEVASLNITVEDDSEELAELKATIADIYDKQFTDETEALEADALEAYNDEYDEDDLEEILEDLIAGLDKIKSINEDEDEEIISVINLGLDDDEDKKVIITKEYKIKYELDDSTKVYKDTVYAVAEITFDEDDGYEVEIEFSL